MAVCSACSRELTEAFAFCPFCGAQATAGLPAVDERKLVTLLFADVTGSTHLAEAHDAEEVRDVMAAYFALAREEIEARGGTVEKFVGDAVLAVFGVPIAHEDDPARALGAALAIRKRLAELNDRLRGEGRPAVEVRIGINSGEVVATTSPMPGEVMVTGDAVNVAARIQQLAEPGQILVGARTVQAAPEFAFGPVESRSVRGKADDVDVTELVAAPAGSSARGTVLRAPLVGRDGELALLASVFDRVAADRRPHLVTIYGQPGVGKSRLTHEFVTRLEARPLRPTVVRGRCLSYGSGVTFWPLAEILKSRAEILDSDPPTAAQRKLESLGRELLPGLATDVGRATALLGYTVGIAVPGHDFSHLDPEVLRAELVEAWRSFFSALASSGPVVAVVEDIHWADAALLDLLDDLGDRVHGPVLFICPTRPDLNHRRPGWGGGRRSFSGIYLDPLAPQDTSRLVSLLLEIEDLPGDLHRRIVDRAGGNPFFAEEILRHLIDQGRIRRAGDGWRAEAGLTTVAIPDTVQAVLAARIDLLGADEKRALQGAAVVGRTFWPDPIGRYLEASPARTSQLLRALENRDFVITRLGSTMGGQPELIFKHALVRDVAYESIPRRDRAVAHLQVARWIEETMGDRRLETVELLAHHFTEAQRAAAWGRVEPDRREEIRSRAVELLLEAAEEAGKLFAMDRAKERLETALELARGPIERARGLEAHARIALWEDDGDEAWRAAREAIDLRSAADVPIDRRAVARLCGFLLALPTRWPGLMRNLPSRHDAKPYLELGLSMLDGTDSEERLGLLMAEAGWGWGFGEADVDPERNERYIARAHEAVALARRLGQADRLSAALDTLGAAVQTVHGYGASLPHQEERLGLAPRLDDPTEVADIVGTLTWCLVHVGDYRRALDVPSEDSWQTGSRQLPTQSLRLKAIFNGVAHYRLGEWDEFWSIFEAADAGIDPEMPFVYHVTRLYAVAAYLREVGGDSDAADRLVERIDISQASRGEVGASGVHPWLIELLIRRGDLAEARRRILIRDPVREVQNRDHTLEAWGELIAAEERWGEAPGIVAEARAWAEASSLLALPAFADKLEGRAALAAGDRERGTERLRRARERLAGLGAVWDAARIDLLLAEVFEAQGQHDAAADAARAVLASIGHLPAPTEIDRARQIFDPG